MNGGYWGMFQMVRRGQKHRSYFICREIWAQRKMRPGQSLTSVPGPSEVDRQQRSDRRRARTCQRPSALLISCPPCGYGKCVGSPIVPEGIAAEPSLFGATGEYKEDTRVFSLKNGGGRTIVASVGLRGVGRRQVTPRAFNIPRDPTGPAGQRHIDGKERPWGGNTKR
jgi:hypothetical protein